MWYSCGYVNYLLASEWRRAERSGQQLSLILLDIDFFKSYNDTYGHLEGDACLLRVCEVVAAAANRASDLAARYGGEELVVLLPDTDIDSAGQIAESIRAQVFALAIPHAGSQLADCGILSVSAGVACLRPPRASSPTALIQLADDALYQAKHGGRNRVVVSRDKPGASQPETLASG